MERHIGPDLTPTTQGLFTLGESLRPGDEAGSVARGPVRIEIHHPPQPCDTKGQGDHRQHRVQHHSSMVYLAAPGNTDGVPEALEAEMYRRALTSLEGQRVRSISADDTLVVPDADTVRRALEGEVITSVRRHGKVVLVDTPRATVAIGFGMTGRLIVGDHDPIPHLAYGPSSGGVRYDRWSMRVSVGRGVVTVRLSDPRRLARVVADRDLSGLGPDAVSMAPLELVHRLAGRRGAIKAVLMDQQVVAGLGNLLVDELLWRSGIDPSRRADQLSKQQLRDLGEELPVMLFELMQRGGSHCGYLSVELRTPGARCPVDGVELVRRSIAGRTSWSCPHHQR
jgi:formamidopyrimidine-DNA glycosylase